MKKTYYIKKGRRYEPVAEYDQDLMDSYPKGSHLVVCRPGTTSRRFNIDPAYAPMIAAGTVAEDAICIALSKATEVRPQRKAMTQAEIDAWNNLIDVWGEEARSLIRPAIRDVAEAGVKAMMEEAEKLMQHESVRKAYSNFLLICELTKEKQCR